MPPNYSNLERPYGSHLERSDDLAYTLGDAESTGSNVGASETGDVGSVEERSVRSDGNLADVWINNFIRSTNWKPKKVGFYIDGQTGYAEFSNVYVSGTISATVGSIGGWTIASNELYSGNVHINSTNEQILFGSATAPGTGTGIFLGLSAAVYQFRVGNPAGAYILWDGSALTAASATITGSLFQTAASGERIEITSAGKRINLINSTGTTVASLFYGTTTSSAIFTVNIANDARRGIEFIVGSGLGSTANCITIDNPAASISINMTDAGLVGLQIAGASQNAIVLTHSHATLAAVDISATGGGDGIIISATPTNSGSGGVKITLNDNSTRPAIFIDNNVAGASGARSIEIDQDLNTTSLGFYSILVDCQNTNTGEGNGIDINVKTRGINITATTGVDMTNVATYMFKFPADATAVGTGAGRIAINIGGATKYLAYYNA